MELIYHTNESISGGISPFDKTIRKICKNQKVHITCPYISIDYIQNILELCPEWKLISDIIEWLRSNTDDSRRKIINFVIDNKDRIRHYPDLHAKVIIGG